MSSISSKITAFLFLLASSSLLAETPYIPWLTGPFLVPAATNGDPGHPTLHPSTIFTNTYGAYKNNGSFQKQHNIYSITTNLDIVLPLTNRLALELFPGFEASFRKDQSAIKFLDTVAYFGYQLATEDRKGWLPNIRLFIQSIFPSGNYQKFNPKKTLVENTGQGSYFFGPGIAVQKLFSYKERYFSLQSSFSYLFPTSTKVKGFNSYGGGYGTKGVARPGQPLAYFLSGEFSLTQNWVLACDTLLFYQAKSHFSGKKGEDSTGAPASVTLPAGLQFSIAPAVEYNFSDNAGFLAGAWLSLAGKNQDAFASLFISYSYTF